MSLEGKAILTDDQLASVKKQMDGENLTGLDYQNYRAAVQNYGNAKIKDQVPSYLDNNWKPTTKYSKEGTRKGDDDVSVITDANNYMNFQTARTDKSIIKLNIPTEYNFKKTPKYTTTLDFAVDPNAGTAEGKTGEISFAAPSVKIIRNPIDNKLYSAVSITTNTLGIEQTKLVPFKGILAENLKRDYPILKKVKEESVNKNQIDAILNGSWEYKSNAAASKTTTTPKAAVPKTQTVEISRMDKKTGKIAIFDSTTKKFLRWAE
jgi:hypothetical protein